MPLISVIVPIYNVESYLKRCLESILKQTYTNYDLILVDDGSEDNSGAICDEYAKHDNRIVVLHQQNKGQAAARNAALDWVFQNSSSEYIGFVDSDDWIHPRYLELLLKASQSTEAPISQCLFVKTDEYKTFESINPEILLVTPDEQYINWYNASSCSKLFKKSCFLTIRFPENMIYEDVAISYKMLFSYSDIAVVNATLYFYFIRNDSTVHLDWTERNYARIIVWENQRRFFSNIQNNDLFSNVMERYLTVLCTELIQVKKSKAISAYTRLKYITKIRFLIRKYLFIYGKRFRLNTLWFMDNAYPALMWFYWKAQKNKR